jgi:hypothetical protein
MQMVVDTLHCHASMWNSQKNLAQNANVAYRLTLPMWLVLGTISPRPNTHWRG